MLWLDKVLATKCRTPASLGSIVLHIAEQLEIDIEPAIFLTQLLLVAKKMMVYSKLLIL